MDGFLFLFGNILWSFHLLHNQVRFEFPPITASILNLTFEKEKEQYEKQALLAPVHRKSTQALLVEMKKTPLISAKIHKAFGNLVSQFWAGFWFCS